MSTTVPVRVEHPRQAFVQQVMGLPVSVHVRGPQARGAQVAAAVEEFFAALREDDARFSTWRPDSPVSRIRRGELSLADAEPRVREVAALCEEAARRTGGAFSAWLPGPDGVRRLRPDRPGQGLGRGAGVRRAARTASPRVGPHDVLVSAGGDVVVACARTDTPDWTIGIEDPQDRSRVLRTVGLRRGAVATSGTAARGQHVIDPAHRCAAVRTALGDRDRPRPHVGGRVRHRRVRPRVRRRSEWIATLTDHVAVLVEADGTVR